MQPSAWLLVGALLLTAGATALLCVAIMTEHWELVTWDRALLEAGQRRRTGGPPSSNASGAAGAVEWLLDGRAARLPLPVLAAAASSLARRPPLTSPAAPALFLVPMHGGIWTLCVALTQEQQQLLQQAGFVQPQCLNYLAPEMARGEEGKTDWQHRMQNLSISCALVCLILLAAAAAVGAFGVLRHQLSAVLVTGVMYLLAATFAMFTLAIIHFKRQGSRGAGGHGSGNGQVPSRDCVSTAAVSAMQVDGVAPSAGVLQLSAPLALDAAFLSARVFSTGWSLAMGWAGVALSALAALLWLLLSKMMRYSPLSSLLA